MPEGTIEGGCNCGKVRYTLESPPLAVAVCHCSRCRRQSGSAFSVNLIMKAKDVRVDGELAAYEDPESESGMPVRREFCGACGSPIRSIATAQPKIVAVKAGTLDEPGRFAPGLHIWTCSALPWTELPEALPRFERGPSA